MDGSFVLWHRTIIVSAGYHLKESSHLLINIVILPKKITPIDRGDVYDEIDLLHSTCVELLQISYQFFWILCPSLARVLQ